MEVDQSDHTDSYCVRAVNCVLLVLVMVAAMLLFDAADLRAVKMMTITIVIPSFGRRLSGNKTIVTALCVTPPPQKKKKKT